MSGEVQVDKMRVLVVDDAILFRRVISDVLTSLPGVEVVGSASNGKIALQKIKELHPDLITLDLEMPEMDGLATLDALRQSKESVEVIVVSAVTRVGGDLTMRALQKGAFDFITKPDASDPAKSRALLAQELAPRIRALTHRLEVRAILKGGRTTPPPAAAPTLPKSVPSSAGGTEGVAVRMARLAAGASKPEMVLIGVSTGGPAALAQVLPALPEKLGVPVLVVQHMPPIFTQSLADSLAVKCALRVREAAHGEVVAANTVYIAPGGKQMRLIPGPGGQPTIDITDDPPENNCKPAVDYLFRSAANQFPGRSMGVILTGMGSDGTLGLRLLKRHGCFVIAQDEPSCVVYGMPKAAVDAGVADVVLPLEAIAARITAAVQGR